MGNFCIPLVLIKKSLNPCARKSLNPSEYHTISDFINKYNLNPIENYTLSFLSFSYSMGGD